MTENRPESPLNITKAEEKSLADPEEGVDKITELGHTNKTFTKKKWDSIDELITVLKEEIDEAISQKQQGL